MNPYEQATEGVSTGYRLDRICISPEERRMARANLRQAELVVDMLMRANADLRRVFGFLGRGIRAAVGRSKASSVTPAWRLP